MPTPPRYPDTPLGRLMAAAGLRWCDLASRSGCSEGALRRLAAETSVPDGLRIGTLLRVAAALGAAPAEVLPILAVRPRRGLLWERGLFGGKGKKGGSPVAVWQRGFEATTSGL